MTELTNHPVGLYPRHRAMIARVRAARPDLKGDAAVLRLALEEMAARLPPSSDGLPPVLAPPAQPPQNPDAARLSAAMTAAGLTTSALAFSLGIERTSVRNILRHVSTLQTTAGGAILAWVEEQERQAAK